MVTENTKFMHDFLNVFDYFCFFLFCNYLIVIYAFQRSVIHIDVFSRLYCIPETRHMILDASR